MESLVTLQKEERKNKVAEVQMARIQVSDYLNGRNGTERPLQRFAETSSTGH